jgi:hypothetical protein
MDPHVGMTSAGIWENGSCFTGQWTISNVIGSSTVLTSALQEQWYPVYKKEGSYHEDDIVGYIPYIVTSVATTTLPDYNVLSNITEVIT